MANGLTRQEASDAVYADGWRYLLGSLRTSVQVNGLASGCEAAAAAVAVCGAEAEGHLRIDLRADRVELSLQTLDVAWLTSTDVALAKQITQALRAAGRQTTPGTGRPVQLMEIAIDAIDIPAIRPFWKVVLGYADEPGSTGPADPITDPAGQGPPIWFQQMDQPREQRNRIHFDLCVAHDEVEVRLAAALAAGGRLVSDTSAPAFWVLADAEGNEICLTTWQGRDQV